jgi:hypothetical protein
LDLIFCAISSIFQTFSSSLSTTALFDLRHYLRMSKPLLFLHLCHCLRLCFTAFISQIHLHLHLRHRLRLCFTAFISQICLRPLKMKRSSSNKELLFVFNSDFSDAEAARGALEITSIGADVGGFPMVSTPASGGGSWKRCFKLRQSWCTALFVLFAQQKN